MANEEQLAILRQGVEVWNKWREENPKALINLEGADLQGVQLNGVNLSESRLARADLSAAFLNGSNLTGADLRGVALRETQLFRANLTNADLSEAYISGANLIEADLREAKLISANFAGSDLRNADLSNANLISARLAGTDLRAAKLLNANLTRADLRVANLSEADLGNADLREARLQNTNLLRAKIDGVNISNSSIYGVNAWDLIGNFKEQKELIITPTGVSAITVDNVEVAQFVYLILNNKKIRDVLNTLTSKTVLILGRFSPPERKIILDALRDKLREHNLLPIVFDFERPDDKDFTETIKTLAGISYFVIADITNPKSSPLELQATVPDYQIPFVPIIQEGESPFAMMVDLQKKYPWVLPTKSYDSIETLMSALKPGIIDPAVEMRNKLRQIKAQEHPTESLKDYLDKTL